MVKLTVHEINKAVKFGKSQVAKIYQKLKDEVFYAMLDAKAKKKLYEDEKEKVRILKQEMAQKAKQGEEKKINVK